MVRKLRSDSVFGITFPLITTSSGAKMGKTASGAVWLDPERTSPYDYYQFWINTDDRDVSRFLALFTFLPMNEIGKVDSLAGGDLNLAKSILAFEATKLAHGEKQALEANQAATSVFGARSIPGDLLPSSKIPRGNQESGVPSSVPTTEMASESFSRRNSGVQAFSYGGTGEFRGGRKKAH